MWDTSFWRKPTSDLSFFRTFFDHCCYGGKRPKHTQIQHNIPALKQLCLTCPGESTSHIHAPWGRTANRQWATAEETAYPIPLCRTIARFVLDELLLRGFQLPPNSLSQPSSNLHHAAQVASNLQPTGKKVAPMVPEFRVIVSIVSTSNFLNGVRKIEQAIQLTPDLQCSHDIACLPAGSRVLRRYEQGVSGNRLSPQQVHLEYCDQVLGPPSFSPMGASSPAGPEVAGLLRNSYRQWKPNIPGT